MWWGWRVTLALFALGATLLAAGLGYAMAVDGFPAPVQDMGKSTPEQLKEFYGRPPPLASGLWWAGCCVVIASATIGVVAAVRSIRLRLRAEQIVAPDRRR